MLVKKCHTTLFGLLCSSGLFLYGCTEPEATAKFVVDSFTATSSGGPINATDSSFISCSVTYHFETLTGTIVEPTYFVGTDTVMPRHIAAYFLPRPVNQQFVTRNSFWYSTHLTGHDSLYAHFIIEGTFWSRINRDSVINYGSISREDSVLIVVMN